MCNIPRLQFNGLPALSPLTCTTNRTSVLAGMRAGRYTAFSSCCTFCCVEGGVTIPSSSSSVCIPSLLVPMSTTAGHFCSYAVFTTCANFFKRLRCELGLRSKLIAHVAHNLRVAARRRAQSSCVHAIFLQSKCRGNVSLRWSCLANHIF